MNLHAKAAILSESERLLGTMSKAPILKVLIADEIFRTLGLESDPEESVIEPPVSLFPGSRLPAFSKAIVDLRTRGMVPAQTVHVVVDDWKWCKPFLRVVVKPEQNPEEVDFSFLAGLSVIVVWSSTISAFDRISKILHAIMRCDPAFLYAENLSGDSFMVKSFKNGIELPEYAA